MDAHGPHRQHRGRHALLTRRLRHTWPRAASPSAPMPPPPPPHDRAADAATSARHVRGRRCGRRCGWCGRRRRRGRCGWRRRRCCCDFAQRHAPGVVVVHAAASAAAQFVLELAFRAEAFTARGALQRRLLERGLTPIRDERWGADGVKTDAAGRLATADSMQRVSRCTLRITRDAAVARA